MAAGKITPMAVMDDGNAGEPFEHCWLHVSLLHLAPSPALHGRAARNRGQYRIHMAVACVLRGIARACYPLCSAVELGTATAHAAGTTWHRLRCCPLHLLRIASVSGYLDYDSDDYRGCRPEEYVHRYAHTLLAGCPFTSRSVTLSRQTAS